MSDDPSWESLINQEFLDLEHRMRRVEDLLAAEAAEDRTRIQARQARSETWRWALGALVGIVSCAALVLSLHPF